jgi:hypothetical protein
VVDDEVGVMVDVGRALPFVPPDGVVRGGEDDRLDPGVGGRVEDVPRPDDVVLQHLGPGAVRPWVAGEVDDGVVARHRRPDRLGVRDVPDDRLTVGVWVRPRPVPRRLFVHRPSVEERELVLVETFGERRADGAVSAGEEHAHTSWLVGREQKRVRGVSRPVPHV